MPIRLLDRTTRCIAKATIEARPESMAMVEQSQQHHYLQGTVDAFRLHPQDYDCCEVRRHLFQDCPEYLLSEPAVVVTKLSCLLPFVSLSASLSSS